MTTFLPPGTTAATDQLALSQVGTTHDASASAHAALAEVLSVVGDRWSLQIIAQLVQGPQRFNDLAAALSPIARTVLSDRLGRLERYDIVVRRQYSRTPVRSNYRLSVAGAELARVAGVLADWGSRHLGSGDPILRHTACHGPVMAAWHCVTCGPVAPRDIESPIA